jgi:hypothetical protein
MSYLGRRWQLLDTDAATWSDVTFLREIVAALTASVAINSQSNTTKPIAVRAARDLVLAEAMLAAAELVATEPDGTEAEVIGAGQSEAFYAAMATAVATIEDETVRTRYEAALAAANPEPPAEPE